MKIEFESREEIERLAMILQNKIFPASIIIDADDLLDACNGNEDRPLPWNWDGFHPALKIEVSDEELDNKQADKKIFLGECGGRSYVAGQLDAIFYCMRENHLTIKDAVDFTGRSPAEINHLYRMWLYQTGEAGGNR